MKKNHALLLGAGATAVIALLFSKSSKYHPLVPNQIIRPCDAKGCGAFKASRDGGSRLHNGIDIVVTPLQEIKSPINGIVDRYSRPNASQPFTGLVLKTDTDYIKIWYMAPTVTPGTQIKKGQVIGIAQDVRVWYGSEMTPHVHIEIWDRNKSNVAIDPTTKF